MRLQRKGVLVFGWLVDDGYIILVVARMEESQIKDWKVIALSLEKCVYTEPGCYNERCTHTSYMKRDTAHHLLCSFPVHPQIRQSGSFPFFVVLSSSYGTACTPVRSNWEIIVHSMFWCTISIINCKVGRFWARVPRSSQKDIRCITLFWIVRREGNLLWRLCFSVQKDLLMRPLVLLPSVGRLHRWYATHI